ncbi:MAG: radical SAM protein [Dehalococcoidia bacterium]|nr:MAG: radical SAM protein [Dehalococcoidia bacterium]
MDAVRRKVGDSGLRQTCTENLKYVIEGRRINMKFLMIYPNNTGNSRVPLGIIYLLTILRERGHSIRLFDMTFYDLDILANINIMRAKNLNFRAIDRTPYGVTYKKSTMEDVKNDLIEEIEQFRPDVIGVSIVEDTSRVSFDLASIVKKRYPGIKIVFGGVFCLANPEAVIKHPAVDIVCIAEGEVALPELLHNLEGGENITDIQGLWMKREDNTIVKNPVAPPIDLDKLPFLDLSFIDDRHFYAPMAGHVYKMVYFASQRGCPRKCTYCSNQLFLNTYKKYIREYLGRKMSIPRFIDNLVYLKENYDINFFQIIDDDFMLRSLEDIKHFHALYKERVDLPFWVQVEANNVTDEKVYYLKDAGCIAASIGIESGNDFIIQKVYNRPTSREATISAFKIMHKYGIRTSGNIIVGVPHEGRKEIFDSIDLVRKSQPRALNVNVYMPFYGTKLRDYCIEKGYLDKDFIHDGLMPEKPVLDMPQITKNEIEGLVRTFSLYAVLPKKYWPMIKKCEVFTKESDEIFTYLEELYWSIVKKRGMDYDVPGFDYDAFFQKRHKELDEKKVKEQKTG